MSTQTSDALLTLLPFNFRNNKKHGVHDWTTPKQLGVDLASPDLPGSCGTGCVGYDKCYLTDRDSKTDWRSAPVATLASP